MNGWIETTRTNVRWREVDGQPVRSDEVLKKEVWGPAIVSIESTPDGKTAIATASGGALVVDDAVDDVRKLHRRAIRAAAQLDKDDRSENPKPIPEANPRLDV